MSQQDLNDIDDMLRNIGKAAENIKSVNYKATTHQKGSDTVGIVQQSTPTEHIYDIYSNIISPPEAKNEPPKPKLMPKPKNSMTQSRSTDALNDRNTTKPLGSKVRAHQDTSTGDFTVYHDDAQYVRFDPSATMVFESAPLPPPSLIGSMRSNKSVDEIIKDAQIQLAPAKPVINGGKKSQLPLSQAPLKNASQAQPKTSVSSLKDDMTSAPSDVIPPPVPLSREQKVLNRSVPNFSAVQKQLISPSASQYSKTSNVSLDGPEEIEFGTDAPEVIEERRKERKRQSVMIKFDDATVYDYDSLDNLLSELDVIVKKQDKKSPTDELPKRVQSMQASPTVEPPQPLRSMQSLDTFQSQRLPVASPPQIQQRTASQNHNAINKTKEEKVQEAMTKLAKANIKKVTVRIYIENAKTFKTLVVTSLQSTDAIAQNLVKKCMLEQSPDWTLFEIVNDLGIERPLRDFELVTDVMTTWGLESTNSLLLKKYGYRESLTILGALETYPRMCGWMYVQLKGNKWQKRFCELKQSGIFCAKDAKGSGETLLCPLHNYDVYTLMRLKDKAPTKFCFAMKSQEDEGIFEDTNEYCRFMCVDQLDKLKDWVLSIRSAKIQSYLNRQHSSVENYGRMKQAALKQSQSHEKLSQNAVQVLPTEVVQQAKRSGSDIAVNRQFSDDNQPLAASQRLVNAAVSDQDHDVQHDQMDQRQHQNFSNLARSKSFRKPVAQVYQQYSSVPQSSAHLIDQANEKSLIGIIGMKQGDPVDNSGVAINKTPFHGKNTVQPLVPLSKKELENIPGVSIAKYTVNKEKKKEDKVKQCSTCGCTDFARNPFKEQSCANCFHTHQ